MGKFKFPVHAFFSNTSRRVDGSAFYRSLDGRFVEVTEIVDSPFYGKQQYEEGLEDTIYVGLVEEFIQVGNFVNNGG